MPRLGLGLPQARQRFVSVFHRHPSHVVRVPCVARDSQRYMAVHVVFPRSLASRLSPDTTGQSSRLCQPRLLAQTGLSVLACLVLLASCGSSKPSRQQLARQCGQRAANSLTPGFGGQNRQQLQREVAQAAADYYMTSGKCSAGS